MTKLRESGLPDQFDPSIVTDGGASTDGGVPAGAELKRFALAVVGAGDLDDLTAARAALVRAVGPHRGAHAAAVVAGFDAINRVADATGIELNVEMKDRSRDLVESLGLEQMKSGAG